VAPVGIRSILGGGFVRKIEIGQRFKQASPPGTVWEVLNVVLHPVGIRHLRIYSLDDPTIVKLISEPTLANERLYRLIKEQ
jgi:hypothetical protein